MDCLYIYLFSWSGSIDYLLFSIYQLSSTESFKDEDFYSGQTAFGCRKQCRKASLELDSTFVSGKKLSRYANKRMQLESSSLIELQNSPMLRTYNFYSQNNNCSRIFPCLNLDGWAGRLGKV